METNIKSEIFTVNGEYVPERDLFRLIKYGTYDILTLDAWTPEIVPVGELTEEESLSVEQWYDDNILRI